MGIQHCRMSAVSLVLQLFQKVLGALPSRKRTILLRFLGPSSSGTIEKWKNEDREKDGEKRAVQISLSARFGGYAGRLFG